MAVLLILASPHVLLEPSGAGARPVHPIASFMGDEKGEVLPPGSLFALPAGHVHHTWTENEEVEVQANFVGPANINFIDPADDPRKKRSKQPEIFLYRPRPAFYRFGAFAHFLA